MYGSKKRQLGAARFLLVLAAAAWIIVFAALMFKELAELIGN